jgi:hypothetical protein
MIQIVKTDWLRGKAGLLAERNFRRFYTWARRCRP